MRFRQFYYILILFLALSAALSTWAKPMYRLDHNMGGSDDVDSEVAVEEEEDLSAIIEADENNPSRKYFDGQIAAMKGELENVGSPQRRMELIKRTMKDIRNFRNARNMGKIQDELYMDTVMHSFEALPSPEKFEAQRCPAYKDLIIINFEPTAEDGVPTRPPVKETLDILKSVCS